MIDSQTLIDAEKLVLSQAMDGSQAFADLRDKGISRQTFSLPAHQQIWTALETVAGTGGTVDALTVIARLEAQGQLDAVGGHAGVVETATYGALARYKTAAALEQTPEMLPVLKKAGVVDAGGKGYLAILEGMLASLRGEPMPEVSEEAPKQSKADFNVFSEEEITFAFDTVFIVRKDDPEVNLTPLRDYLNSIGDSLVIGEDDEAFKVHVHTNVPGSALTEAQKFGTLELAKIENMRTQYDDVAAGKKAQSVDDLDAVEEELENGSRAPAQPEKRYGFLSVCAGDGLADVFRDLGVDGVISGGQTMNPSTESILKEIERVPAETVFVLPNNKNITMAAQQCVGLASRKVVVVPTETIPQGVTAMMNVDPEMEPEELLEVMKSSISGVATAQITYAARNSDFDGFAINEGDYLSLLDGKLFGTNQDINVMLEKLAEKAEEKGAEFVTLFYGENVTEEQAAQAEEIFAKHCPGAELSVLPGGQPVYYYIISIE